MSEMEKFSKSIDRFINTKREYEEYAGKRGVTLSVSEIERLKKKYDLSRELLDVQFDYLNAANKTLNELGKIKTL